MRSWCCTAPRVYFLRAPSQTSFLRDTPQVYKDSCVITGDSGHVPIFCWWLFSYHPHTALWWKAGSNVHPPTLTVGVDNATCSDCKFLRSSCWWLWGFSLTILTRKTPQYHKIHKSSEKEQTGLLKIQRWGKPFFQFTPLVSTYSTAEETQQDPESFPGEFGGCWSTKSLAKPPLPCPTWVPSTASPQLWQVLAGSAPAAPAAGPGNNRKNRNGQSAAELCWTTGSGFLAKWHHRTPAGFESTLWCCLYL